MMKSFQTCVLGPAEIRSIFFKPVPVAESTWALHSYTRVPRLESNQPPISASIRKPDWLPFSADVAIEMNLRNPLCIGNEVCKLGDPPRL